MKIQCDACGVAEAAVLCCADEAALCAACDEEVHAANKLAGKHQRVPLLAATGPGSGSPAATGTLPKCDICQEACGYFFCLEDRALLCRDCDVSIHTVNPYVSAHQRFLLTGVQVGLEPAEPVSSVANNQLNSKERPVVNSPLQSLAKGSSSGKSSASLSIEKEVNGDYSRKFSFASTSTRLHNRTVANATVRSAEPPANSFSEGNSSLLLSGEVNAAFASQISRDGGLSYGLPFSGGTMSDDLPDWPTDDYFGATEYNKFGFDEDGPSKADISKLGSSESSPQYPSAEGLDTDEFLGLVPENSWTVPEVPSPPTASGLYWQANLQYSAYENTTFVPDVGPNGHFTGALGFKRRRRQF